MKTSSDIPNRFLAGLKFRFDRIQALWRAWKIARQQYPNHIEAWQAFRCMAAAARENTRIRHLVKGVETDGRVYTLVGLPGRPSPAFDQVVKNELLRCRPLPGQNPGLATLLFAFTKKCPLRCEHCFEWEALNQRETLSLEDILTIIRKFQARGVGQIELSGGEPMVRFADMLEILRRSDTERTDFWVLTSGFHLTAEKARQLKAAGLRGVSVSLDHWSAPEHDRFRGMEGAYDFAVQAAQHARNAGLATALSLVPTHAFCTPENLWRYAELARELGVHFIRILEPRAAGHYAGLPVELTDTELAVCENFVREIQRNKTYRDYPLVEYHATFQRIAGCGGAGKRYLYVDTDGDVHPCPFCRHKYGNAVTMPLEEIIQAMKNSGGCPAFHTLQPEGREALHHIASPG